MTLDLKLARAAGQDEGNRAMRAAGRAAWSVADWNVAAETTARLLRTAFQAGGLNATARDGTRRHATRR